MSVFSFIKIPVSIVNGIIVGILIGIFLAQFFKKVHVRDTIKVIIISCCSFILVSIEDKYSAIIPFASLISIMCIGISLQKKRETVSKRLSIKFNKMWVIAEVILFVLVGATVDLRYVKMAGFHAVILIFGVLVFRMIGVLVCLIKTRLSIKERLFCTVAYIPKATVQAAIGGVPLALGLRCGNIVITVAVFAILITAPLGAFLIECTYKNWLNKND